MKKENMYQDEIEQQIINKITPTKKDREKLEKTIEEIHEKIEEEVKKKKLPVKIELVGSTAKDTYLKDNLDIDFFLLFPLSFSKNEIAKHVLSIGKKILIKTEESYAEHPYIRGYYKKYKVEIVPCYQIEKAIQKLSAVDRTPLHTRYIKENLEEKQKKEVRLLKQFLKGINCYGAEAEIEGFSGYLCELLILKYGSFRKLIQQAQHWKPGETLMLTFNDKQHPVFDTPLTFIDPVDSNRNVASALSKEKFELFTKACQEYLKKPSITFFFPNPVKPWSIKEIKNKIIKEKMYFIG
ncbi:MAG: CCA tRNA nucleotidyltransferase, partial [Thermoplasmata archaeon]